MAATVRMEREGEPQANVTGHYHVVGAAGVGMSAVARALQCGGCEVTGSDRYLDRGDAVESMDRLRAAGIEFFPQDGSGVRGDTRGVVISTAIEDDNPDLAAARAKGVPVLHRAEMLARMVGGSRCVAVTGTSGKSTVTGMIGWMLEQAGRDPTVINGAPVVGWDGPAEVGNVRWGRSGLWVLEADESDRSLMSFAPDWAVITNASADHFGADEADALFRAFMRRVRRRTVGAFCDPDFFRGFECRLTPGGSEFTRGGETYGVPLPGRHNAENAAHAVAMCAELGCEPVQMRKALAGFRGIRRRLERVGEARGVVVIDDYAHNPAKIAAAWSAVAAGGRRVFGVWRPHGYRPLATMMEELAVKLAATCGKDDRVWVLPVYDAGGTADRSVHSGQLVDRLRARGVAAEALSPEEAPGRLASSAESGDAVLIMGARDPHLPELARRVVAALAG